MSNKIATLKYSVSYTGPNGEVVSPPTQQVLAPYQAQAVGTIDVPDAESASTVHAVPFGGIGVACTLGTIENQTGQELAVKINGASTPSHHIAPGGAFVFGEAVAPGSAPVTALSLTTTAQQSGAGFISYRLFGDPVAP